MSDLLEKCQALSLQYVLSCISIGGSEKTNIERYFLEDVKQAIYGPPNPRLTIYTGPRGIGKTTALLQALQQDYEAVNLDINHQLTNKYTRPLYITMDDYSLKNDSLYDIGTAYATHGGKRLLIDEVHKYPNWSQEIKNLYDKFPHLNMIISGSSLLEIHKATHDLSRRAVQKKVYGMSFREFLQLKYQRHALKESEIYHYLERFKNIGKNWESFIAKSEEFSTAIVTTLQKLGIHVLAEFEEYCRIGYYPYFEEIKNEEDFRRTLQQQIAATIESDIPNCYPKLTGASTRKINQLLAFLAESVPYTPNFKTLKEALEIGDERTLKEYLNILEKAQLIQSLKTSPKGLKQVETTGKIFLHNTNLQWALTRNPNAGSRRETVMMSMLEPLRESHTITLSMPKSGDLLVQYENKVYTFEIGGKSKTTKQIQGIDNSYVIADNIEIATTRKIPLWLFGFLY